MSVDENSLFSFVELLKRAAPGFVDLLTAQSDEDFEAAFDVLLQEAVSFLEKNSKNFSKLDEVGLSANLARGLTVPLLTVTQEAHNNGHVDITIERHYPGPVRRKLVEAKIYNGPKYHIDGLEQLLNRYMTGREGRGVVIEYVRKPGISHLIKAIRDVMDAELPCMQQGSTADHTFQWAFLSRHAHSCGDVLSVAHVGCNLYYGPGVTQTASLGQQHGQASSPSEVC